MSEEKLEKRQSGGGMKKKKGFSHIKKIKSEDEVTEIERLKQEYDMIDNSKVKKFSDLPLSRKLLNGLKMSGFTKTTDIQKESIGLALKNLDILGAAKTGSGKTLAFIIPVLEKLYINRWTNQDGLGALIITPTRELAYQIFETLRNVGRKMEFSAGLIIGGKDLKFERKRVDQLNIIVCTPGRILQHMDECPSFDCSNLQILVLDEADRCLDMGFQKDMNAVIANLPIERQTLLFSATQTKSVKDLARLSLKSPVYVSVHENSKFSTPEKLQQSYIVCPLENKLDTLWSFIKHHKKSKTLIFLSSCKQVRFIHMLFCRMRPGISLLALHGELHQLKRMASYEEFCSKEAVVLFATDVASRGLDFPNVDWVIQLDCPEDTTTYIHRAGRTARLNESGEALLFLLPSEEQAMVQQLQDRKIPIEKIEVSQKKMVSVQRKFEALLARDVSLKEAAQRAFKSYIKAVFLMKNKQIFDATKLDLTSFARSFGLAVPPRVRFLQKRMAKVKSENGDEDDEIKEEITEVNNQNETFAFDVEGEDEDGCEDLFKGEKRAEIESGSELEDLNNLDERRPKKVKSKASMAKKLVKKNITMNKKLTFDEEGGEVLDRKKERQSELARNYDREDASGVNIEMAKEILKMEDQYDKEMFRERIRAKHREARIKAKMIRKGVSDKEDEVEVTLENHSSDENEGDSLAWLPDPDKIYGKEKDESDDGKSEEPIHKRKSNKKKVDNESEEPIVKKRKSDKKSRKGNESKKKKPVDTNLIEEFALHLLSNK